MFKPWRKFAGWTVAEYFLRNPTARIHIKGLARELGVSPRTAEQYCKWYEAEGLLEKEKVANASIYFLDNDDFLAKALKRAWFLSELRKGLDLQAFAEENALVSLALYGSRASGEFTEKSDIDLLCITAGRRKAGQGKLGGLEARFAAQVGLTAYSVGEWRKLKEEKTPFYESVKGNHVLLWGAGL
ncbi:MAG: nucleotidyltransferase domain-containing protein [Candidatus Micrarchaeota archaeon]